MSLVSNQPSFTSAAAVTEYFKEQSLRVEACLDGLLPGASEPPQVIHEAMRYSVFAGGKRLRPALTVATGEAYGADGRALLPAACALEMIHTYSLIHDDLPAMDDDSLRRGRPTNHVVYGEAIAILAGDALLTRAFQTLSEIEGLDAATQVRVIREVAQAAGTVRALIGGQVLDMRSEGRRVTGEELSDIHAAKTGALIRCAVRVGAVIGGAGEDDLDLLTEYGEKIGLAFQIADDLLDATATSEELGKTAGKDAAHQKATYVALYGFAEARRMAAQLCAEAVAALHKTGREVGRLEAMARFIIERKS
jgi:geranylgeranyl diphosphate synthase, type II